MPIEPTGNAYLDTLARLEPDIAMIDTGAGMASIAVSLKRIADSLEGIEQVFTSEHAIDIQGSILPLLEQVLLQMRNKA